MVSTRQPAPRELVAWVLPPQTLCTALPYLFGIWPHLSFVFSSASLDFSRFLGSGVAWLPGSQIGFTFDRHTPKLDFLSPVTSTGACPANCGSFVIKTLWWC